MKHQYCVIKYNPAHDYPVDEWILFSQVGQIVGGKRLTMDEYLRTENAYIESGLQFLSEAGVGTLIATAVEDPHGALATLGVSEGSPLDHARIPPVMRENLRDNAWCRLESDNAFIKFGYDCYMYIGVPIPCEAALAFAQDNGLFVEDWPSRFFVAIEPPEHGWMRMILRARGAQAAEIDGSYTPNDWVGDLVSAVTYLAKGGTEASVGIALEPGLVTLRFEQVDVVPDEVRFTARRHENKGATGKGSRILTDDIQRGELCVTFWRAFRRLASQIDAAAYEEAWGHPFPAAKIEELGPFVREVRRTP